MECSSLKGARTESDVPYFLGGPDLFKQRTLDDLLAYLDELSREIGRLGGIRICLKYCVTFFLSAISNYTHRPGRDIDDYSYHPFYVNLIYPNIDYDKPAGSVCIYTGEQSSAIDFFRLKRGMPLLSICVRE